MIVPGLFSRGQLQLRPTDPQVPLRIDPDCQAEEADMRVLDDGAKLASKMHAAPALDR